MKKIICVCIFLSSGCGKLLNHVSPADTVVENEGSEVPHSLPSDTSKASASEPEQTFTPVPTPTD